MSDAKVIDLIDRQAMADELNRIADCAEATHTEDPMIMVSDILKMLYWQPSQTDYEMVRHGKWVEDGMDAMDNELFACDQCGHVMWSGKTKYCPNCGALMDVDGDLE